MLHLADFYDVPFKDLPSHQTLMSLNLWPAKFQSQMGNPPPSKLKTQEVIACCPARATDGYGATVEWRIAEENETRKTPPRYHLVQNESYIKSPSYKVHPAVYSIGSSFQRSKTAGVWSWPFISVPRLKMCECSLQPYMKEVTGGWRSDSRLKEVTEGWRSDSRLNEVTGGWRKWQEVEGSDRRLKKWQ
jgi:hypothetical protein